MKQKKIFLTFAVLTVIMIKVRVCKTSKNQWTKVSCMEIQGAFLNFLRRENDEIYKS